MAATTNPLSHDDIIAKLDDALVALHKGVSSGGRLRASVGQLSMNDRWRHFFNIAKLRLELDERKGKSEAFDQLLEEARAKLEAVE